MCVCMCVCGEDDGGCVVSVGCGVVEYHVSAFFTIQCILGYPNLDYPDPHLS